MELKGLKIHREDGTIDTYPFPIPSIIVNSGGGSIDSGDAETTNKLYMYKSGDADFVNCSYSLGNKTITPPSEEEPNYIQVDYIKDPSSPSNYGYFDLALNTTFAEYNKLYIEAHYYEEPYKPYTSDMYWCGFLNKDEDADNGDVFYDTGYVWQDLTETRTVYEFDISGCTISRIVSFLITGGWPLRVYNIWLEK
jgi:hypothetical protein